MSILLSTLRSWTFWFIIAWSICIGGVIRAASRGFNTHLFGDFASTFLTATTLISWLGLTATFSEPLRGAARKVLSDRWGSLAVVISVGTIGGLLLFWSHEQIALQLTCRPAVVTVWLDGERQSKPCDSKLWASQSATLLAYAEGFSHTETSAATVHAHGDLLTLNELPRWSCTLYGGKVNDARPFVACGQPNVKPWTQSRTWGLTITRQKHLAAPHEIPSLKIERTSVPAPTGVAIQTIGEDCYARADKRKAPDDDDVHLAGCGHDGTYTVNVTVCATDDVALSNKPTDWMKLYVQEQIGEQPYHCDTAFDDPGHGVQAR